MPFPTMPDSLGSRRIMKSVFFIFHLLLIKYYLVCDSGCEVSVVRDTAGLHAFEVDDEVVDETFDACGNNSG